MSLSPQERQTLFLELARADAGTTAQLAYEEGCRRGDEVSEEAYFNLGRRLTHRGMLRSEKIGARTVYFTKIDENATWLDEEHVAAIIDPEYPLLALTAYRESIRQIRDIPEELWIEARTRLSQQDARQLFADAIHSYADNLMCEIKDYARERAGASNSPYLANMRSSAERSLNLLVSLCKNGLGLSNEAISLPVAVDIAAEAVLKGSAPQSYYDEKVLREEISKRVEAGTLIRRAEPHEANTDLIIAGVDGSSVGGLLSLDGAGGDFAFGHAPQVSINTAIGILNRDIKKDSRHVPAFLRLPEKPEDMQQRDNRYTIMAKMFYPDLTDSEYIHSTWNAMDLLECRTALSVMSRWTMPATNLELPAADVVLRDGTIVPHDRDSNHYGQQDTYGRIVRDLIEASWKIVKNCREDAQTVIGVVKNAQMRVLTPVINYYLGQIAGSTKDTQFPAWALNDMNQLPDQALLSRILTAGRKDGDPWLRTTLILRPFHATSDFGRSYSRNPGNLPHEILIRRSELARDKDPSAVTEEEAWWRNLRVPGDPYIQMLQNVWYAGFYLGAFRQLDRSESLSRMEFVVPHSTEEDGEFPASVCADHLNRTLAALQTVGFQVDNEHSMFNAVGKIDLLPSILVKTHETVKAWAKELRDRVSEFMDWQLAKYLTSGQKKKLRLRPWTRRELQVWIDNMHEDRRKLGG